SALVSFDAVELRPGEVKSILFSLTASKEAGISAQLNQMKEFKSLQDYLIYWYSFDSSFQMLCDPLETAEPSGNGMVIFPNPASDYFNIRSTGSPIKEIALYDILGRWIGNYKASLDMANTIRVEVAGMSPGVYMVSWRLQDGKQGLGKVVGGR
ncbi:MAG: T9SS type A sorting domain-containing protein, partial [Bacteroidetes bacterium]|nr:T9SS type A sorting domain-containing protein [Bacteroidota bacterium]